MLLACTHQCTFEKAFSIMCIFQKNIFCLPQFKANSRGIEIQRTLTMLQLLHRDCTIMSCVDQKKPDRVKNKKAETCTQKWKRNRSDLLLRFSSSFAFFSGRLVLPCRFRGYCVSLRCVLVGLFSFQTGFHPLRWAFGVFDPCWRLSRES